MATVTYAAAGIIALAMGRAYMNTPALHPRRKTPDSSTSGVYSTETKVSVGNDRQYMSDSSHVIGAGYDVYGVPYQDIREPDGSRRKVYGNWTGIV